MKSVLISIHTQWVNKIVSGKKTIEVRKTAPQEVPFKAYIYCCKAKSKWSLCDYEGAYANSQGEIVYAQQHIIGEFICDKVDEYPYDYCDGVDIDDDTILETAIDREDINIYAKGKTLYGWHISDLKIYDEPRKLSEFYTIDKSGDDCCIACVYHETPVEEMSCKTCTGERRYLYRPPQSWQYVGEVEQTI